MRCISTFIFSKPTGHFILSNSWGICVMFRFFGFYPFKRSGNSELTPTSKCRYWVMNIPSIVLLVFNIILQNPKIMQNFSDKYLNHATGSWNELLSWCFLTWFFICSELSINTSWSGLFLFVPITKKILKGFFHDFFLNISTFQLVPNLQFHERKYLRILMCSLEFISCALLSLETAVILRSVLWINSLVKLIWYIFIVCIWMICFWCIFITFSTGQV